MPMTDSPTPTDIRNADGISLDASTLIIAGSRSATDVLSDSGLQTLLDSATDALPFDPDAVISGTANGVDTAGERWADRNEQRPIAEFEAPWSDTDHPDAVVRSGQHGQYDARAGYRRNRWMAQYAAAGNGDGALLAIIDYPSSGTESMIDLARDILGDENVFVVPIGENADEARDEFADVLLDR